MSSKNGDRAALALEVMTRLQPGWSVTMSVSSCEARRKLESKEQEVYDAALDVLSKALKSESK